jgi:hypothetical protein
MELAKKEIEVLKALVKQELEEMKKDSQKVMISNSPFLNKEALDDSDLEFLKSGAEYQQFLKQLLNKL